MSHLTDLTGLVCEVFIETGTGSGRSLRVALEAGFTELHSIEADPQTATFNRVKFRPWPNVHVHQGRAVELLPTVIDPTRSTLFWLDAHYSGGSFWYDEISAALPQCELLGELACITAVEWTTPPIVLIDDAFMFEDAYWEDEDPPFGATWRETFRRDDWPTIREIEYAMMGWRMNRNGDVLRFDGRGTGEAVL